MILQSKITPERRQITPDHTRSFQNHALGTYFLYWASPNNFSSLPPFPPQTEGNPPTSNGPTVDVSKVKKKTYQWSQLGKIDQKEYQNMVLTRAHLGNVTKYFVTALYHFV